MTYDNILYDTDGRVATVTLNRPEKLNALSNELRGEMFHALKAAEADSSIGVIIIKGAGRAFSAGYDLQPSPDPDHPHTNQWTGLPDTGTTHPQHYDWSRHAVMGNFIIWELAKPVIGQIHGYCLAGATELASACDLRIAAEDTYFALPEVDLGVPVRWGGVPRLVRELGPSLARELMLTCRPFTAHEAKDAGFLTKVIPPEELDDAVRELADTLCDKPGQPLRAVKRSIAEAVEAMTPARAGL